MKKLIFILSLLPFIGFGQGTTPMKIKRLISDSIQLVKLVNDTTANYVIVTGIDGKFRVMTKSELISDAIFDTSHIYAVMDSMIKWPDTVSKVATFYDLTFKEPLIAAGTTSQYWRGDKSWQVLPPPVVFDTID